MNIKYWYCFPTWYFLSHIDIVPSMAAIQYSDGSIDVLFSMRKSYQRAPIHCWQTPTLTSWKYPTMSNETTIYPLKTFRYDIELPLSPPPPPRKKNMLRHLNRLLLYFFTITKLGIRRTGLFLVLPLTRLTIISPSCKIRASKKKLKIKCIQHLA